MFKRKLEVVTIGSDHLSFWRLSYGSLIGDSVDFGVKFTKDIYCQAMNKLDMVLGTGVGSIQVLRESLHTEKKLPDSAGKVFSITVSNLYIFAGSQSGRVYVLSSNYLEIQYIMVDELIPSTLDPQVVSITTNHNYQGLLVLLRSGELVDIKTQDIRISKDSRFEAEVYRQSHFNRKPNKLSHIVELKPTKYAGSFASIAEDGTLRQWDISEFKYDKITDLCGDTQGQGSNVDQMIIPTSFDCSSDFYALIGFKDGSLKVVEVDSFNPVKRIAEKTLYEPGCSSGSEDFVLLPKFPVTSISFSQDATRCAVGYSSGELFVFDGNSWRVVFNIRVNKLPLISIDWTMDGKYLGVENSKYELVIYKTSTQGSFISCGKLDPPRNTLNWKAANLVSSWQVMGFRSQISLEKDVVITCMHKSNGLTYQEILAVGLSDGTIRVYNYPVLFDRADYKLIRAHHGTVTSICITSDNQYIACTSSVDDTIIVYKLEPEGVNDEPPEEQTV